MSYPGGKNGSGVYQTLINLMPPHQQYIEPFLGMGGVMRHKKPAFRSFGIDSDVFVIGEWANHAIPGLIVEAGDGIRWLKRFPRFHSQTLVYCDPPYLATKWPLKYRHKMTAKDHENLLEVLLRLRCMVMVSGYPNAIYAEVLRDWRRVEFTAWTRGLCPATEVVWMNFPAPRELHDYRFLGQTFREREVIKRRIERWKKRFSRMHELESFAMFAALDEVRSLNARTGEAGSLNAKSGEARGSSKVAMVDGARAQSPKVAMVPEESPDLTIGAGAAVNAGSGEVS